MISSVRCWAILGFVLTLIIFCSVSLAAQDTAGTYKAKCAVCHGADGKGNSSMAKNLGVRDFSSRDVQQESDSDLKQIIQKGKNKMPAYGTKLSDAQIKDLVAYVRELGKGR